VLVGRTNARFGEPASNGASLLRVDVRQRAIGDAAGQRTRDARIVQGAGAAALEGGRLREPFQLARQTGRRKEDRRLDEGEPDLRLGDRWLPLQQTGQALGLAVRKDDRVVDGGGSAIGRPGPAVHIAGQNARTALDFDEEEAGR